MSFNLDDVTMCCNKCGRPLITKNQINKLPVDFFGTIQCGRCHEELLGEITMRNETYKQYKRVSMWHIIKAKLKALHLNTK